jgi:hypothetical protein
MLFRGMLKLAIFISAIYVVCVGVVAAFPYDASALNLLLESENCDVAACWQGIEPGVTTADEAVALLENHPWIGMVDYRFGEINWQWNGTQPAIFDATKPLFHGRMLLDQIENPTLDSLSIPTHATFGDFWLALGEPDYLTILTPGGTPRPSALIIIAGYQERDFFLLGFMDCPIHALGFWQASVTVAYGRPELPFNPLYEANDGAFPKWLFRNLAPGCHP